MQFKNLTPHPVGLIRENGETIIVVPQRTAARVVTTRGARVGDFHGVPIFAPPRFEGITGLPEPEEGVCLIVSQITALAVGALDPSRNDVFYPATGRQEGAERDADGVLAVRRLIHATPP